MSREKRRRDRATDRLLRESDRAYDREGNYDARVGGRAGRRYLRHLNRGCVALAFLALPTMIPKRKRVE